MSLQLTLAILSGEGLMMSQDPSKSDDAKKPADGEDEFLGMDPGAFDSVNDLFADPSMVEGGEDEPTDTDDHKKDDDDDSEESDLLST
jgi:hypothetical protein